LHARGQALNARTRALGVRIRALTTRRRTSAGGHRAFLARHQASAARRLAFRVQLKTRRSPFRPFRAMNLSWDIRPWAMPTAITSHACSVMTTEVSYLVRTEP